MNTNDPSIAKAILRTKPCPCTEVIDRLRKERDELKVKLASEKEAAEIHRRQQRFKLVSLKQENAKLLRKLNEKHRR